jgi:hypothetical protein
VDFSPEKALAWTRSPTPTTPMADPTFAEAWCAKHGTAPEAFATTVLPRALHAHARLVAPVIRFFDHNHFAADLDLVRAAGGLRRVRDLADEITDFNHHPANTGFWRQTMNVRISTHRLRHLMRATLPHHAAKDGSRPPVPGAGA